MSYLQLDNAQDNAVSPGGLVIQLVAAVALNVGDAVYISAAKNVSKSAVAANYVNSLGIVVGGERTGFEIIDNLPEVGARQAAAIGEPVLVLVHGVTYVVCDAAIAVGVPISASILVAGRVRAAVLPVAAADSRVLGRLLEVAGAAADVRLAIIGPG